MPLRIQRRLTKGWRMPPNTICVSRPSIWGNPFPISEYGLNLAVRLYKSMFYGWNPLPLAYLTDAEYRVAYQRQMEWKKRFGDKPIDLATIILRGHNLCCWCKLCEVHRDGKPFDTDCCDCEPCHADPLGRMVNA